MSPLPGGSPIQTYLDALHRRLAPLREGLVAAYIPELAHADPAWFGIAIATVDGHLYSVGDTAQCATIQSISKPFVYGMALAEQGVERVLAKVGVEPTGEAFNSISLEPDTGRPLNPMINAGAIAVSAMIAGTDAADGERRIMAMFERYTGRTMAVDERVYASEARTGHRNRALAHLMRNFDIITGDPEPGLDLYFRQCSVLVDCRDLAIMGATLANDGVNPLTGARALAAPDVARVLAVMTSCGMYDFSGGWIYRVGMPAKSGVAGGIIAVLPGQMGIAVFSPPLDSRGNSVRGIRVCEEISADFALHLFHTPRATAASIIRSRSDGTELRSSRRRRRSERTRLRARGARVRLYELQGELNLGATESLVHDVLRERAAFEILILDLTRVVGLDQAAARLLSELAHDLQSHERTLLLPGGHHQPPLVHALAEVSSETGSPGPLRFTERDQALEWAEDQLLGRALQDPVTETPLIENDLCETLDANARDQLITIAERLDCVAGQVVYHPGDPADALFLIARGQFQIQSTASARIPLRCATLGPGLVFGDLPLATGRSRDHTVIALNDRAACWRIPYRAIAPELKVQLLASLATRLAERLTEGSGAGEPTPDGGDFEG
ncbi:glutaminase A [Thiocapsa imhoffii]|uniref:Glutaminase n=1 Tax=Thiocapsa imhoffii TaxID=382777 RepID=A0A9X1B7V8_9GAMM|nr:glutaminase A [Thiocapsa imhoffii]MBK1643326.1 glutaminase A [Thiocapsa imhoffii]